LVVTSYETILWRTFFPCRSLLKSLSIVSRLPLNIGGRRQRGDDKKEEDIRMAIIYETKR
jgi:hypothetical protein